MAKLIFRDSNEVSKKIAVRQFEKKDKRKKFGIYSLIAIQTIIIIYLLIR